jgi:hypothetical protein
MTYKRLVILVVSAMVTVLAGIVPAHATVASAARHASNGQSAASGTAARYNSAPRGTSTSGLAKSLTELFAESRHLPRSAVAGMRAGSLRTARDGNVEWAYARFVPSATANSLLFQDGGSAGVFERTGDAWRAARANIANDCAVGLPTAIAAAWDLNKPALCQRTSSLEQPKSTAATITGTAPIALSQVGVTDNPPTNSFANEAIDCNPYTAIESSAPTCDADSTVTNANGTTTTVQNEGEYWCSDFAKWVWAQDGQPDLGTLNAGADSFYTWGNDQGETLTNDGTDPQVGDAVVLYGQLDGGEVPGPGVVADHVGIITKVYSNGYVDTVNGDFQGTSVIGVYEWTDMSLSSYASDAEGSGEMWVLVSPADSGSTMNGGDLVQSNRNSDWDQYDITSKNSLDNVTAIAK